MPVGRQKPPEAFTPSDVLRYWCDISGRPSQAGNMALLRCCESMLKQNDVYDVLAHFWNCKQLDESPYFFDAIQGIKLDSDPMNRYRYWARVDVSLRKLLEETEDKLASWVTPYDVSGLIIRMDERIIELQGGRLRSGRA